MKCEEPFGFRFCLKQTNYFTKPDDLFLKVIYILKLL